MLKTIHRILRLIVRSFLYAHCEDFHDESSTNRRGIPNHFLTGKKNHMSCLKKILHTRTGDQKYVWSNFVM
jgi:hypothetical protein